MENNVEEFKVGTSAEAKAELDTLIKEKIAADKMAKEMTLVPIIQTCMLKTKHGRTINCKFWIHTKEYFQYYEPGYKVVDMGDNRYIIEGDTCIIPDHEIQYVVIRNSKSALTEQMFLALGGKKKMIEVAGGGIFQK